MTDLKIVNLPTKTVPHATTPTELAAWLRDMADDVENGEYPAIERVVMLTYAPGSDAEAIHITSNGVKDITHLELLGILDLAHAKQLGNIRK